MLYHLGSFVVRELAYASPLASVLQPLAIRRRSKLCDSTCWPPTIYADYYPESDVEEEETVEEKQGFEAMLAASEKARKQLQLR